MHYKIKDISNKTIKLNVAVYTIDIVSIIFITPLTIYS